MAPGDRVSGTITIKNTGSKKMDIALVNITSNTYDRDLYRALKLKIYHDGEKLYSGAYNETPEPVTDYLTVPAGKEIELYVSVKMPEYVGNALQDETLDCTWIFEAKYHNDIKTNLLVIQI